MTSKKHAVIRGKRATDDLIQIEMSGPDDVLSFACPDCQTQIPVGAVGVAVCAGCGSVFTLHGRSANVGRRHVSVRRKPVD